MVAEELQASGLMRREAHLPAKRLTVIKAPTGFGKTSLAASWSEWPRFY
jgi:ATP/maltotriose-dependent transcriptional regulator MalT